MEINCQLLIIGGKMSDDEETPKSEILKLLMVGAVGLVIKIGETVVDHVSDHFKEKRKEQREKKEAD